MSIRGLMEISSTLFTAFTIVNHSSDYNLNLIVNNR